MTLSGVEGPGIRQGHVIILPSHPHPPLLKLSGRARAKHCESIRLQSLLAVVVQHFSGTKRFKQGQPDQIPPDGENSTDLMDGWMDDLAQ